MKLLLSILCFFTIVSTSANTTTEVPRKKVGLVLSGGGAKGMAHIGAIKVIEEIGNNLINADILIENECK